MQMCLLTVLTVKKFEFPKSKMADGRHFEKKPLKRHISATVGPMCDEIRHGDANLSATKDKPLKLYIFQKKTKWRRSPQKSRCHNNELTDLREIWHDYAKWVS